MSPSEREARTGAERVRRIEDLVAELTAEVDAGLGDGAIAALAPDTARRLVATAARTYAVATEEGAQAPTGTDLTPTEAVVLATAALRAHDLNPFDLALWFSRSTS